MGKLGGCVQKLCAVCAAALETIGHACEGGVNAVDLRAASKG